MLFETQSAPPLVVPSVACHKVRHHTWVDSYYTFLGIPADSNCGDLLHRTLSEDGADEVLIADAHQFGDTQAIASVRREMRMGNIQAPETALLLNAGAQGGVQFRTIGGVHSTPLMKKGRMIGSYFEDADAKYCILGDLLPSDLAASPGEQTTDVLQTIQEALVSAGMDFRHIVRTWFYNDRILDWYAEFNRARSTFFQRHGIAVMPASTGIGVANTAGAALVAKAIAVLPKNGAVTLRRVESPLQCEASAYGSAFSRGFEVADQAARVLYISGTASIEPGGETAHVGNPLKQIEKTMEVVEAILDHNGMTYSDTIRAIGYFRHREHIPLWNQFCRSRELPPIPIILTECDVCRDNLLFEIELDAARPV